MGTTPRDPRWYMRNVATFDDESMPIPAEGIQVAWKNDEQWSMFPKEDT